MKKFQKPAKSLVGKKVLVLKCPEPCGDTLCQGLIHHEHCLCGGYGFILVEQ